MIFDFFKRIWSRKKETQALPYDWTNAVLDLAPPPKTTEDYLKAYQNISWVYACVRVIAETISSVNWRLYDTNTWDEIEDHEAIKLFDNPNPFFTRSELFRLIAQNLELTGESFILLLRDQNNKIIGLLPLNPVRMDIKLDGNIPSGYVYHIGDKQVDLSLDDVIFIRYPNPASPYRGVSPLMATAISADVYKYASEWNRNFFYNAASPSAVLQVNGNLTDKQRELLKKQLETKYRGLKNAHKFIILEGGIEFKPISLTHRDMEFLALMKYTREEIAAIFGVPLSKIGLLENVNRATAYVSDYSFHKNTIQPKLILIKEAFNKYYLPHFGENLYLDFDSIVPQDEEFLLKQNVEYLKLGVLTINEVREELGYEPVEWGDTPYNPNLMLNLNFEAPVKKRVFKSQEERLKFWDEVIKRIDPHEKDFKGWISARFEYQKRKILDNLNKKSIVGITKGAGEKWIDELIDWLLSDEELETWESYYKKKLPEIIKPEIEKQVETFGLRIKPDFENPYFQDFFEQRAQKFAKRINETTYKQLKQTLLEGLKKGESETKLAERVEKTMTLSKRQRAATIARTETFSTLNQALSKTYEENGIQYKEWLTARDERVRPAHAEADGQIVRINEPFMVGGEYLMQPGDPSGSAKNTINCRCISIPVIS